MPYNVRMVHEIERDLGRIRYPSLRGRISDFERHSCSPPNLKRVVARNIERLQTITQDEKRSPFFAHPFRSLELLGPLGAIDYGDQYKNGDACFRSKRPREIGECDGDSEERHPADPDDERISGLHLSRHGKDRCYGEK